MRIRRRLFLTTHEDLADAIDEVVPTRHGKSTALPAAILLSHLPEATLLEPATTTDAPDITAAARASWYALPTTETWSDAAHNDAIELCVIDCPELECDIASTTVYRDETGALTMTGR